MKIEHEISYGTITVYVTADKGTHHSTMASAAWQYLKELPQPDYVASVTGVTRPGKWCLPQYGGPFKRVGSNVTADSSIRKTFKSWPVPA